MNSGRYEEELYTREGDARVRRRVQCRGSGPGVKTDERVISRGGRQSQCRPVHRGRPAHTQCMVQLPEVHPRTVRPTERSPRAQNPDAESRGARDNAVRLRHVEPARVPLRHPAPSPPKRVCRCHDVFLWCYLCFVLLRFRLYVFVEAAALRSTVLRYAGAPIATHTCFFLFSFLLIWRCRVFRVFFVPLPFFSLYGEYVVRSFLPIGIFLPCDQGLEF